MMQVYMIITQRMNVITQGQVMLNTISEREVNSHLYGQQNNMMLDVLVFITFSMLGKISADDILKCHVLFSFTYFRKQVWTFNANCPLGGKLHEMPKPLF